ncbi:MAG: hypothetical protein JWO94_3421 [Verrucomicrobiaceae bacterium]|nr:hypothetical protein [Verrucomicrobiaceae bacterium]
MLIHLVKDLQDAEEQLRVVLPRMWDSTMDAELAAVLRNFLQNSMAHGGMLTQMQQKLGDSSSGRSWNGMDATVKETLHAVDTAEDASARDLLLVTGSQRIKGLKIAGYGAARSLAEARGWNDVADSLADMLTTEMEGDLALVETAHRLLNS